MSTPANRANTAGNQGHCGCPAKPVTTGRNAANEALRNVEGNPLLLKILEAARTCDATEKGFRDRSSN